MKKIILGGFVFLGLLITYIPLTAFAEEAPIKIFSNVADYNRAQQANANKFKIENLSQSGSSCVCHSMLNMEMALTGRSESYKQYESEMGESCSKLVFIYRYNLFKRHYPGEVFGGTSGLTSLKFVSGDKAIKRIVDAIDDGKVVAVGLNADPLYDDYEKTHHLKEGEGYKHVGFISHAVVIIGIQRESSGYVSEFIVADSSGPERKYHVSANAFRKAYCSYNPAVLINRGVYIPEQSINQRVRYDPF